MHLSLLVISIFCQNKLSSLSRFRSPGLRRGAEQVREAMPCDPPTLHLGADFRKRQNENTKSMQNIKLQKTAKVSKYLVDFDSLCVQTLQGSLSALSKLIFATKYRQLCKQVCLDMRRSTDDPIESTRAFTAYCTADRDRIGRNHTTF